MKALLPRTLLGRTVLVLILTIALTETATQLVFRYFISDEFSRTLVRAASNNFLAIGRALRSLPPEQRAPFAMAASEGSAYQLVPVDGNPLPTDATVGVTDRLLAVQSVLRQRLDPRVTMWQQNDAQGEHVWLRLPVPGGDWWVRFDRRRFDRAFPISAAILLSLSLVLAAAVAWLTVRRINRPLRAIQNNILRLSRGGTPPPPLLPDGPAELADLAAAVNRMSTELTRAEQERALLLAGISHDLRTPLSRLRLGMEMLGEQHPEDVGGLVSDIEDIDRIIDQFLDFARSPEATPGTPGDLSTVVHACAERYRARGLAVLTAIEDKLALAMRQPALDRLLNNLVENAWRYAGAPVTLAAARQGNEILLSVMDRGPGIPAEDVERLLKPFTRLDSSRTGPVGAGLGLAIVERIARAHGGSLRLAARDGGGLVAQVRFPAL